MSIKRTIAVIREVAEATLEQAYKSGLVEHHGSFMVGPELDYLAEFGALPKPHIVLIPPIASRANATAPLMLRVAMGFYDDRSIENHTSEQVAEIQGVMEDLFLLFHRNLSEYEDEFGAPLPITAMQHEVVNRQFLFMGTGIAATFLTSLHDVC